MAALPSLLLSSASRSLTSSNGLRFAPALLPAHGCCCCTLDGSFSGLAATVGVGQSECSSRAVNAKATGGGGGGGGGCCAEGGCAEKPHHSSRRRRRRKGPGLTVPQNALRLLKVLFLAHDRRNTAVQANSGPETKLILYPPQGMFSVSCSSGAKIARGKQL